MPPPPPPRVRRYFPLEFGWQREGRSPAQHCAPLFSLCLPAPGDGAARGVGVHSLLKGKEEGFAGKKIIEVFSKNHSFVAQPLSSQSHTNTSTRLIRAPALGQVTEADARFSLCLLS